MKVLKLIGLLLIFAGLAIPINYSKEIKNEEFEEKIVLEEVIDNEEEYFAILEIPSISLKKELFQIADERNNVDRNLLVVKESVFPESSNSNVIIAGHSGNGKVSHFKDLYKVKIGEEIKLYYNNYVYTYQIREIELQNKTGTLYLINNEKDMMTLITCTKNDKKHQTIYYAELKTKENMSKIS